MFDIFIKIGGRLFRQVIVIKMRTNCAPSLANLFLHSYDTAFLDNIVPDHVRTLSHVGSGVVAGGQSPSPPPPPVIIF